jgi:hypothetical protein
MSEQVVDPFSEILRHASLIWELYRAYVAEGFTEDQAFELAKELVALL